MRNYENAKTRFVIVEETVMQQVLHAIREQMNNEWYGQFYVQKDADGKVKWSIVFLATDEEWYAIEDILGWMGTFEFDITTDIEADVPNLHIEKF